MEVSSSPATCSHVSELHKTARTDYTVKKMTFPLNTAHVNGGSVRGKENSLHVKAKVTCGMWSDKTQTLY